MEGRNDRASGQLSRRGAVAGFGVVAVGGAAGLTLAGCQVDEAGGGGAEPGTELAGVDDVPVGGGVIVEEANVVVTQPAEGEFRGFTATCTHQGCTVSEVADGTINCACHGSRFAIEDASVVSGPAEEPLSEVELRVDVDGIAVA
ncbi:Rieske (2Fe-2S) protein [Haloechinothrix sp. LS1_15]|uniref:Rieske (2Fe-2S) protein n=1 Tax=Haloechinothrix sp. LS1_15 TaxID=2652248 RepID=UPI00294806E2|nr:Rieske (2Fe-2S) protein [Haloechinothrix sp. LS1_15]MDV6013773.1 Rieske (2Fe-2S) protein [Haloechinothrix sp. LS1_15]